MEARKLAHWVSEVSFHLNGCGFNELTKRFDLTNLAKLEHFNSNYHRSLGKKIDSAEGTIKPPISVHTLTARQERLPHGYSTQKGSWYIAKTDFEYLRD